MANSTTIDGVDRIFKVFMTKSKYHPSKNYFSNMLCCKNVIFWTDIFDKLMIFADCLFVINVRWKYKLQNDICDKQYVEIEIKE